MNSVRAMPKGRFIGMVTAFCGMSMSMENFFTNSATPAFRRRDRCVELVGRLRRARMGSKTLLLERDDIWMRKMRFGHDGPRLISGSKLAGAEEHIMTEVAADARPFDGFEGHAIRARQSCRHKADIHDQATLARLRCLSQGRESVVGDAFVSNGRGHSTAKGSLTIHGQARRQVASASNPNGPQAMGYVEKREVRFPDRLQDAFRGQAGRRLPPTPPEKRKREQSGARSWRHRGHPAFTMWRRPLDTTPRPTNCGAIPVAPDRLNAFATNGPCQK